MPNSYREEEKAPLKKRNSAPRVDFLDVDADILAEEMLKNVNATPIGKLLKRIATMPEIRKEKVTNVRKQLNQGNYDVENRLDLALDIVIEELIN